MKRLKGKNPTDINVYLIGSGIASLASAVYLIEDAGVPAANIHILEKSDIAGGALDGAALRMRGLWFAAAACTKNISSATGISYPESHRWKTLMSA